MLLEWTKEWGPNCQCLSMWFQTLCVPGRELHPSAQQLPEQNPKEAMRHGPSSCEKSKKNQRLRGFRQQRLHCFWCCSLAFAYRLERRENLEGEWETAVASWPTRGRELSSMIHSTQNTTGKGQWVKAAMGTLCSPKKHTAESSGAMVTDWVVPGLNKKCDSDVNPTHPSCLQ